MVEEKVEKFEMIIPPECNWTDNCSCNGELQS